MAIIRNPQTFNSSGHTGGTVFFSRYGKQLSRSFPSSYKDKNSIPQQNQRIAVFKPTLEFCRQLKFFAKSFYQTQPSGRSAFAEMFHQVRSAFGGTAVTPTCDLTQPVVGNGDGRLIPLLTLTKVTTGSFQCSWDTSTLSPYESSTDTLFLILSLPDGSLAGMIKTNIARSVGTATVGVHSSFADVSINVSSCFFVSTDGKHKNVVRIADDLSPVSLV
jgi:hypothetical protein